MMTKYVNSTTLMMFANSNIVKFSTILFSLFIICIALLHEYNNMNNNSIIVLNQFVSQQQHIHNNDNDVLLKYQNKTNDDNLNDNNSNHYLLLPIQLLEQYKKQHSNVVLQSEITMNQHGTIDYQQNQRQHFVIGYYSCPYQVGNRFHHFFNTMIWSIILNITVLYHYYDQETCNVVGIGYDPHICQFANTIEDCTNSHTIQRADWIPSYNDWLNVYNLPLINNTYGKSSNTNTSSSSIVNNNDDGIVRLHYWTTHMKPSDTIQHNSKKPKYVWNDLYDGKFNYLDERINQLYMIRNNNHMKEKSSYPFVQVIEFPQMLGQDCEQLINKHHLDYYFKSNITKQRANDLFSNGIDFFYGMLFREVFPFHSDITQIIKKESNRTANPHMNHGKGMYNNSGDNTTTASIVNTSNSNTNNSWESMIHNNKLNNDQNLETFSIVIHSRHSKSEVNGSNIEMEKRCLLWIMKQKVKNQKLLVSSYHHRNIVNTTNATTTLHYHDLNNCRVYIMSDRLITIEKLSQYIIDEYNCTPQTIIHDNEILHPLHNDNDGNNNNQTHDRDEHGPFSGIGYLHELAYVTSDIISKNYIGFIGTKSRSSSHLIIELLEYDQRIINNNNLSNTATLEFDIWKNSSSKSRRFLPTCWLPKESLK